MKRLGHALTLLMLAAFAIFAGWSIYLLETRGGGWASLGPAWPYLAAGMATVGLLTGGLMWLAFFSERRGYDEPYDVDHPNERRPR